MDSDTPESLEDFASWLHRRMAHAVEAGEVPAELLADIHAELAAARERPHGEGHAVAIQHIAGLAGVPEDEAAKALAAIEAQPSLTQELLLRRFVEAWLGGQRRAYRESRASADE